MDVRKAHEILIKSVKLKGREVVRCFEYNTVFTFELGREVNSDRPLLDSIYFVNKKTGKIGVFSPLDMPLDEYKAGKEITRFK